MNGNINDMCNYIASVNPEDAIAFCEYYEYNVDASNPQHISETMAAICDDNGKVALKDALSIHPDKQAILDAFNQRTNQSKFNACGGCQGAINPALNGYGRYQSFYANGDSNANTNKDYSHGVFSNMISMQTNTILVLGLIVVGGALLFKNLK